MEFQEQKALSLWEKKRRYTLGNLLYISSSRSVNVIPVELVLAMLVLSKRDCEKKRCHKMAIERYQLSKHCFESQAIRNSIYTGKKVGRNVKDMKLNVCTMKNRQWERQVFVPSLTEVTENSLTTALK